MKKGGIIILGVGTVGLGWLLLRRKAKAGIVIQQVLTHPAYASGEKYFIDSLEYVKLKGAKVDLGTVAGGLTVNALIWNGTDQIQQVSVRVVPDGVSPIIGPGLISIAPKNWAWSIFSVGIDAPGKKVLNLEATTDGLSASVSIPFEVV